MVALHLRGVVLPDGEERELWTDGETLTDEPVPGAETVEVGPTPYLLPGLVDAHCHIGLGPDGGVDRGTAERQARADRDSGVLLVRDCGVPVDTRWVDERADLPRVVRCGRHIARAKRYIRNYAVEVEPDELAAEVERQVAAGDGWVKVVGDWIDRSAGDLAPLWPAEVVRAAVSRAHELGARVAVHVFAEEAVADWVAAGVDCVEHGTGLTDDVIASMAARGTVLDPTLVQIENFPTFADQGEARFPTYARHMRDLHRRRFDTVGRCIDAGVSVVAGSDAGGLRPHGTLSEEIALLAQVGGAGVALAAASWGAREWLGVHARLEPGGPADLVVCAADPRTDPAVLSRPAAVVLRGTRVV